MEYQTNRGNHQKKENENNNNETEAGKVRRKALLFFLLIVFLVILAVSGRYLYLYVTESKVDSDVPYPVTGIDVSSYQGQVDWKGLEKEGIRFAFIKATEGTTIVDSCFEYNWKEAHKTNLKIGAYHFLSYSSAGETQAQNFINTVDKKWGMMPPVVDVEFYGKYLDKHPTKEQMYQKLDIVIDMLEEEYSRVPIIYTNRYIYRHYISGRYDRHPIWISDPEITEELYDGKDWLFCQYTFTGKTPSIGGGTKDVDFNVFNGSKWEFRRYNGKEQAVSEEKK